SRLLQRLKICLRELIEQQIVAEASRRIAGTALLAENAVRRPQMLHHPSERRDDLAPSRIVSAHASQPQEVLLRAVERREVLLRDEFVALAGAETERVAVLLQRKEQLGAVIVLPLAGVDRAPA